MAEKIRAKKKPPPKRPAQRRYAQPDGAVKVITPPAKK